MKEEVQNETGENNKPWHIIYHQARIAGVYSAVSLLLFFINPAVGGLLYTACVVFQSAYCFFYGVIRLFYDKHQAAQYLLSGIAVLVIGFSVCAGFLNLNKP